jgi:hypothetical protein
MHAELQSSYTKGTKDHELTIRAILMREVWLSSSVECSFVTMYSLLSGQSKFVSILHSQGAHIRCSRQSNLR